MIQTRNGLTIEVYGSSTSQIVDPDGTLQYASGLNFASGYPGGLYLDCSFFVPRDLGRYWAVRGAQRVVIHNGQKVVYEGKIDNIIGNADEGGAEGSEVQVTGYWGALMMRYAVRKRWADSRITEDIWKYLTEGTGAEKCTVDRQNRIRFTPKAVAWANTQWAAVRYTMPTGRTAKRIKYSYVFAESGQQWEISAERSTDAVSYTAMTNLTGDTYAAGTTTVITGDATGNIDVTLATPSRYLLLRFRSRAAQTPAADGTIYGEFSGITVYDETGTINAEEIAYDVIGLSNEISTSISGVYDGLHGETLPAIDRFCYDDFTSLADILTNAASYGNTAFKSIYFQMRASEEAETNNGRPTLYGGVYPDLTSADYAAHLSDENVISANIERDYEGIYNWIAVAYTDEKLEQQVITPDDTGYTALTDATSVAAYGRRSYTLSLGHATAAMAYANGQRFLARWKNPQWRGSVTVIGYIHGSNGNEIPASEIEAGKVLDIADYMADEVLTSDVVDYPRVIITGTAYDDETETCVLNFGPLDDMVMEAAYFLPTYAEPEARTAATASGGGNKESLNWKRKLGLKPGTAEWEKASKASWAEKQAMIDAWKKKRKKKG